MSKPILEVKNISKSFEIAQKTRKLRQWLDYRLKRLLNPSKYPIEIFEALQNISFEIKKGEIVGLIGQNGSGKSTLLKILSRITPPTKGTATIYGKVGAMIEIGTGFNKELSGLENIYLYGAILGLKRKEIELQIEDIIQFAEIPRNLMDTPLKKYSSGMKIRLAFAVMIHLQVDLFLLDEILAVSDIAFQQKGIQRLKTLISEGKSAVLVSHDMNLIEELCDRVILLEKGKITFEGATLSAIHHYKKGIEQLH